MFRCRWPIYRVDEEEVEQTNTIFELSDQTIQLIKSLLPSLVEPVQRYHEEHRGKIMELSQQTIELIKKVVPHLTEPRQRHSNASAEYHQLHLSPTTEQSLSDTMLMSRKFEDTDASVSNYASLKEMNSPTSKFP